MKTLILGCFAALALSGCIAVPYGPAPAPEGYYYYGPPVGNVYFGYSYHGGGHRGRHW